MPLQSHQSELNGELLKTHWAISKAYIHLLHAITENEGFAVTDEAVQRDMPPFVQNVFDVLVRI